MSKSKEIEEGLDFIPQFDSDGLIPCITTSVRDGEVLMFAYMNKTSIEKSIETGEAHYWSRSRQSLWHKGATSGYTQKIKEMLIDCDQDCLLIRVDVNIPEDADTQQDTACHTGRRSCFYRAVDLDTTSPDNPDLKFTAK